MGYSGKQRGLDEPSGSAADVTPSDTVDLMNWAVWLYVGSAGDVRVTTWSGDTATFRNCPAGGALPVRVRRVWSTGTTAGSLIACW